jgi:hypothetical protein
MGLDFALIKQSALPLLSNTPPPQKKKKEATSRTQMNEIYVKSKTKICPSLSKILKKLKQFHATEKVDMNGNKKKENLRI